MKLTQIKNERIDRGIINKLATVTTGICLGLMVMPGIRAAEVSNFPVAVELNKAQTLLAQRICTAYRVIRRNGLYVYHGNRVIATIPYNQIVSVTQISRDGKWAKVYYQGGYGWVASNYLSCYQQ